MKTKTNVHHEYETAARHLLYIAGENGGRPAGGFFTRLIHAALHADVNNELRLASAFPHVIKAVSHYKREGIERLSQEIGIGE